MPILSEPVLSLTSTHTQGQNFHFQPFIKAINIHSNILGIASFCAESINCPINTGGAFLAGIIYQEYAWALILEGPELQGQLGRLTHTSFCINHKHLEHVNGLAPADSKTVEEMHSAKDQSPRLGLPPHKSKDEY